MLDLFTPERKHAYGIVLASVVAAIAYGIVHDLITAHVAIEYFFPPYHDVLIDTDSPVLVALAFGSAATWWVGLLLGTPLAIAARGGQLPKLKLQEVLPWIAGLFVANGAAAATMGLWEFSHSQSGVQAVWTAHLSSYAVGIFGGCVICFAVGMIRFRRQLVIGRTNLALAAGQSVYPEPKSEVE